MAKALRRFGFVGAVALSMLYGTLAATRAADITPQELTVQSSDYPVPIKLFPGQRDGRRPAVIILHGRQGIDRFAAAYTRYAEAVAAKGIDAVLVSYYDATDTAPMNAADQESRQRYFAQRRSIWARRVRDVITWTTERREFSGSVGLLGFSNGGFLAVATAAADPRINALVVFYAGIASGYETGSIRLPPLLALHGDADRNVPLSSGQALVDKAKALGAPAELIVYPEAGHGFDFDLSRNDARDATGRAVTFLAQTLLARTGERSSTSH